MKCPKCQSTEVEIEIAGQVNCVDSEISKTGQYQSPSTELVEHCLKCGNEFITGENE